VPKTKSCLFVNGAHNIFISIKSEKGFLLNEFVKCYINKTEQDYLLMNL
jgi:hypothetical protein